MTEIGKPVFEATPTNGQTEKGPDSNWAYDHEHDPDAHGNDLYPWLIQIQPFSPPKAQTNWATIGNSGGELYTFHLLSTGAQNAEITWDIVLAKGTWNITIIGQKNSDRGIISIQFDSVERATLDEYSDPYTPLSINTATGIVVPVTKKIELKLKMATKNGSSSAYAGSTSLISLIRTA